MSETMQASPKALSPEEATQRLLRKRAVVVASDPAKEALRLEKERWAEEIARFAEEERERQRRERIPPTRERLAKGDITNKSDRTGNKAAVAPDIEFQVKDPLDNVRKHLTDDEWGAIGRLIVSIEHARKTRAITANYEGTNGGGYGPRHGGVPDTARKAKTIADFILDDMHQKFQELASALSVGVQREKDGQPLTPREIMSLFLPDMGDKARKDGGWIAFMKSLAWRVQEREKALHEAIRGEKRGSNLVRQIIREERS